MTQQITTYSSFRSAPGHIVTPEGAGREAESLYSPFTLQQLTLTIAGTDPVVAGDYTVTFVMPVDGSIVVTYTAPGGQSLATFATALAAAINATPSVATHFTASAAGAVITLIAKSYNLSIAVPTTGVPGGTTNTAAQSVAAAAPSLRMGLWYRYGTIVQPYAISGSPRGAHRAALPTGSTTIAQLRGVIARAANQTTLSPTFKDGLTYDAYEAGQIFPGALRGEVWSVVDPASAAMTIGSQVHVVIAAGTYSVIGSVAAAADGGNTLRLDDTTPVRAKVTQIEESVLIGAAQRLVLLKVNQTN